MAKKTKTLDEIVNGIPLDLLSQEDRERLEFEIWQTKEGDKTHAKRWYTSEANSFTKQAKAIFARVGISDHPFDPSPIKEGDRFYPFLKAEWESDKSSRNYARYLNTKADIYRQVAKKF